MKNNKTRILIIICLAVAKVWQSGGSPTGSLLKRTFASKANVPFSTGAIFVSVARFIFVL